MLSIASFINKPEFQKYNLIPVDDDESYAANSLWIDDKVLFQKDFQKRKVIMFSDVCIHYLFVISTRFYTIKGGDFSFVQKENFVSNIGNKIGVVVNQ